VASGAYSGGRIPCLNTSADGVWCVKSVSSSSSLGFEGDGKEMETWGVCMWLCL
jgi:hypothetical protein